MWSRKRAMVALAVGVGAAAVITPWWLLAGEPPPVAATPGELLHQIGTAVDAARAGSWIAAAGAIIMVLTNVLKLKALGGLVKQIPARWRIAIPIILGGAAGILASIAGGMPATEAVIIGLFSGPTAVFAHEAVIEAVLGRSKTRNNP